MGSLATTSRALALTRDSDDNPLWHVAGLLLRPLHLGLAFPSILYVAAMTVFLFTPTESRSESWSSSLFCAPWRFATRSHSLPHSVCPCSVSRRWPYSARFGSRLTHKPGALSPASSSSPLRCFTSLCWSSEAF